VTTPVLRREKSPVGMALISSGHRVLRGEREEDDFKGTFARPEVETWQEAPTQRKLFSEGSSWDMGFLGLTPEAAFVWLSSACIWYGGRGRSISY
jgi:hypothetical protein